MSSLLLCTTQTAENTAVSGPDQSDVHCKSMGIVFEMRLEGSSWCMCMYSTRMKGESYDVRDMMYVCLHCRLHAQETASNDHNFEQLQLLLNGLLCSRLCFIILYVKSGQR